MSPGSSHPPADLASLQPGTHLCAFHRDDGRLTRIAATFVDRGLSCGDRVQYVASDEQADALLATLPERVHARDALATRQLLVSSFADAYGTGPTEDLGTVADGVRSAAGQARKHGFPGLRVAARMDGMAALLGSAEDVLRWERLATDLQRELGVSSVCLYDSRRLDEEHRALVERVHAGLAPESADTPLASFLAVDGPWGLRVDGEVDLSNRDLLQRMLMSRAAVTPRLHVDLAGLTFVDVGTLSRLCAVAAALPDEGCLVLRRVPAAVRRLLDISGLGHERLRLMP